jgi:hypothetical protein
MSTLVDMLYREYCRARLAEMRKQLLIPVASEDILQASPSDPGDQSSSWPTKEPPTIG